MACLQPLDFMLRGSCHPLLPPGGRSLVGLKGTTGGSIELQKAIVKEGYIGVLFILVGPGSVDDLDNTSLLLGSQSDLQTLR